MISYYFTQVKSMEVATQSDLNCIKLYLSKLNRSFCKGFYISSDVSIQIYIQIYTAKIRVPLNKGQKK